MPSKRCRAEQRRPAEWVSEAQQELPPLGELPTEVSLCLPSGQMAVWNSVPMICTSSWPKMKCYLNGNCPDIQCLTLFTWRWAKTLQLRLLSPSPFKYIEVILNGFPSSPGSRWVHVLSPVNFVVHKGHFTTASKRKLCILKKIYWCVMRWF